MYRAVFTSLFGLMLLLGTPALANTSENSLTSESSLSFNCSRAVPSSLPAELQLEARQFSTTTTSKLQWLDIDEVLNKKSNKSASGALFRYLSGYLLKNNSLIVTYEKSSKSYSKKVFVKYKCEQAYKAVRVFLSEANAIGNVAEFSLPQAESNLGATQSKIEMLEAELAKLKNENVKKGALAADTFKIVVSNAKTIGPKGTIEGQVFSKDLIDKFYADGQAIPLGDDGKFVFQTYVPDGGLDVVLEALDVAGLSSSVTIRLNRSATTPSALTFDRLNPIKSRSAQNADAVAIIVGVAQYKETNALAIYSDNDAKIFADYAAEKLGVARQRIVTLVNENADEKDVLLAIKNWLSRTVKQEKSDVYIFFAGHGLASDDGEKMYLLPYDGAPELLDKTAILRDELFADIAQANPRSVTVFLDTCYSGTTRGPDMLIASRPIAIRAKESAIPEGFTVMTAAAGDQTAKPLEEAKHGMFSYFLMKGMEGDADANQDNQITAGELHAYVQQNVIQQSSGSQTPQLQGDADRVLVRFQ